MFSTANKRSTLLENKTI